jgi:hypothetical protein
LAVYGAERDQGEGENEQEDAKTHANNIAGRASASENGGSKNVKRETNSGHRNRPSRCEQGRLDPGPGILMHKSSDKALGAVYRIETEIPLSFRWWCYMV